MIIEESFTVHAPRDVVAAFLADLHRVSACVPGVEEIEDTGGGRYTGALRVHAGPIRAAFRGEATVDTGQAPERLAVRASGRDRATGSAAEIRFTAELAEPEQGRTTVTAVCDVVLRGRLAQFGSGVIRAIAAEMVRDFAEQANARLAAPPAPSAPSTGSTASAASTASTGSTRAGRSQPDGPRAAGDETAVSAAPPRQARLTLRRVVWLLLRGGWRSLTRRWTRGRAGTGGSR